MVVSEVGKDPGLREHGYGTVMSVQKWLDSQFPQ